MRTSIFLIFYMIFLDVSVYAQESKLDSISTNSPSSGYYRRSRMVGLNMTPMLSQLIPFGSVGTASFGPFVMRFKNYKKNNAFRFGMGISIVPDDFFNNNSGEVSLNIQLGWEKRKHISNKWSYTRGCELLFLSGKLNIPNEPDNSEIDVLDFGVGLPWGVEYALAPNITLSTEAEFMLLFSDNGVNIRTLPPLGLFLNYYFSKNKS